MCSLLRTARYYCSQIRHSGLDDTMSGTKVWSGSKAFSLSTTGVTTVASSCLATASGSKPRSERVTSVLPRPWTRKW